MCYIDNLWHCYDKDVEDISVLSILGKEWMALVKSTLDSKYNTKSSILTATKYNEIEVLRALVELTSNTCWEIGRGQYIAAEHGYLECLKILLIR